MMTMNTSVGASIATRHICQGFSIGSAVSSNFLYQIETLNLFVDEIHYRRNCSFIQELKISISPALANYQPVMVITKVCLEFRPKIRAVMVATITQCTNTLTLYFWWELHFLGLLLYFK